MRPVVVVLPASMWAMRPMFLQRSNGTVLGTTINSFWAPTAVQFGNWEIGKLSDLVIEKPTLSHLPKITQLLNFPITQSFSPPVMRERLIRFRHPVNVFLLLDRRAFTRGGVQQLVTQLVDHAFFAASARIRDQPADRQRRAAVGIHFHRNLIV